MRQYYKVLERHESPLNQSTVELLYHGRKNLLNLRPRRILESSRCSMSSTAVFYVVLGAGSTTHFHALH
jgi:hypothetical protein